MPIPGTEEDTPQSTIVTVGQSMLSVHVMLLINSPELCIERRTLASPSSV